MRARRWIIATLLALATLGLVASPATAGPGRSGGSGGSGGPQGLAEAPALRGSVPTLALAGSPQVWYTHWYSGPKCNGNVCTITSVDTIPRFYISGQNFTVGGTVDVAIFRMDGTAKEWYAAPARTWPGYSGGSWGWAFNLFDCWAIGSTAPADSFIQAYDRSSGVWSNRIYVYTGCRVL